MPVGPLSSEVLVRKPHASSGPGALPAKWQADKVTHLPGEAPGLDGQLERVPSFLSIFEDAQDRCEVGLPWSPAQDQGSLSSPDPAEPHFHLPGSQGQAAHRLSTTEDASSTDASCGTERRALLRRGRPCPPPALPRGVEAGSALSFSFPGRIAITGAPRAPAPRTQAHTTRRVWKVISSHEAFRFAAKFGIGEGSAGKDSPAPRLPL